MTSSDSGDGLGGAGVAVGRGVAECGVGFDAGAAVALVAAEVLAVARAAARSGALVVGEPIGVADDNGYADTGALDAADAAEAEDAAEAAGVPAAPPDGEPEPLAEADVEWWFGEQATSAPSRPAAAIASARWRGPLRAEIIDGARI